MDSSDFKDYGNLFRGASSDYKSIYQKVKQEMEKQGNNNQPSGCVVFIGIILAIGLGSFALVLQMA